MSELKTVTLSKLKSMSGADIISSLDAGTLSVEINGQVAFEIVKPLNGLDEKFLAIASYISGEVAATLASKSENMAAEDMLKPETSTAIVEAVAEVIATKPEAPKAVEPKSKTKPKKKPAPKPVAKKATAKKPASPKPAPVAAQPQPAPLAVDTQPFPENTPGFDLTDTQDAPPADMFFDELILDADDHPIGDVQSESDLPKSADAYFDDTVEDMDFLNDEPKTAPDVSADPFGDDDMPVVRKMAQAPAELDDDMFGDDTPIIRKMAKKK